jgi:thiamine biosynthesis lipoprotein
MSAQKIYFFTMDTFAESTVITKKADLGKEANAKIQDICEETENEIVTEIPRELLELAEYMNEHTNGAFNHRLGELMVLWGFKNHGETTESKFPEIADFEPALEKVRNGGGEFDLGAIGKGYAIDKISGYLADTGIPNALVSLSSSVLAAGKNKSGNLWTIGIKDPLNPDEICGYLNASDKVISVSGGYERFVTIDGVDYCHIIDPETGCPVDNDLICVVVVMRSQSAFDLREQREKLKNNGAISDALSTALYVMGKSKALDFYITSRLDFEMILFVKDDSKRGYDILATNVMFTELN